MRLRIKPDWGRLAVYAALAAIVLAPVLSVRVPGLGDYLNHLARMHVLASITTSPDLQRFYRVQWAPIPYLAMDAVVPLLARALPIYLAGKLFACACLLMPVAGAASLHYAVHRRFSLVPAAGFLFSYNILLSLGFLSFLFSAGWAVMLFAGWVASAAWPRWRRAALFAPAVLLLYFGHAFACLGYCLSVAGYEIGRAGRARFQPAGAVAADVAAALAQAVPAIVCAATLDVGAGYVGPLHTVFGDASAKIYAMLSPLLFGATPAGLAVLLAIVLAGALLLPRARFEARIWPAFLVVGLVALAVPHLMSSTWGTDLRLPLIAGMLLVGGVSLPGLQPPSSRRRRRAAIALLVLLVAAKSADAWVALRRADGEIAETRQVLSVLPRGARLLVVNVARGVPQAQPASPSTIWHMPMVAVIDRDAFLPYLFNGLATVHMQPAFVASSTPNGFPITPAELAGGLGHPAPAVDLPDGPGGGRLYHFGWERNFDYVLVQRFGLDPGKLPPMLDPVAHAPDMDLYRVRR